MGLRRSRPQGPGHRRGLARRHRRWRASLAPLPRRSRFPGGFLRLYVRRGRGRPRLPSPLGSRLTSPQGTRGEQRPPGGLDDREPDRRSGPMGRSHPRTGPGDPVGHGRGRGLASRLLAQPRGRWCRPRVPPVHIGVDRRGQGGHGFAPESPEQLGHDPSQLRVEFRQSRRFVAPPAPRHGAHRRRLAGFVLRRLDDPVFPRGVPPATRSLARIDQSNGGVDQRRAEFCL